VSSVFGVAAKKSGFRSNFPDQQSVMKRSPVTEPVPLPTLLQPLSVLAMAKHETARSETKPLFMIAAPGIS
jgi:hypothetical protein